MKPVIHKNMGFNNMLKDFGLPQTELNEVKRSCTFFQWKQKLHFDSLKISLGTKLQSMDSGKLEDVVIPLKIGTCMSF